MTERGFETAVVIEKIREFDRVATAIDIPNMERLSILNISEQIYTVLCAGNINRDVEIRPELLRRLTYALPLMRRLSANTPAQRHGTVRPSIGIQAA